jgi:fluoride exporter
MSVGTWLAAGCLGGAGAILRFLIDAAVSRRLTRDFPYGTLVVNLSGAVLLGLTVGLAVRGNEDVLLGSATIGAYTTFSTWMLETHRLAEEGELTRAAANAFLSLGLGLAAAALGRTLGAHL